MGILSPAMSYIVDKEADGFPSPSEKIKLNKAIGRYRLILETIAWRYDIGEIKFALADLLVGRNDPGDYDEATKLYDEILAISPDSYLGAKAMIGKAELLITSAKPSDLDKAILMCDKALKLIDSKTEDFFVAKGYVVKAELINKRAQKDDRDRALILFGEIIKRKTANWYFKARAMIGAAELMEYNEKSDIDTAIKYSEDAVKLLRNRPNDYFFNKGKIVNAELLTRKKNKGSLKKAEKLLRSVIVDEEAHKDLVARAKLDLAEMTKDGSAEKLTDEVQAMSGLDPYLIEKAKLIEGNLRETRG